MFTGIIESLGRVEKIDRDGGNIHFTIASDISDQLKTDQSLSHDGVCLTVVALQKGRHTVTAIEETLRHSNLGSWKVGQLVNLERALVSGSRLDGHIIQGHVDTKGTVRNIEEAGGSWYFEFEFEAGSERVLVNKGSITVNGVSLTVVEPTNSTFKVAIIPYTYAHTNFKNLKIGDTVNLEFDVIGKYIARMIQPYRDRLNQ